MYPRWSKLTDAEKALVNNGCGPSWMPEWAKKIAFSWMFHAQCGRHDFGYAVGGSEWRRLECDLKFGLALLRDATRNLVFAVIGTILAPVFFLLVLGFGWSSFHYTKIPLSKSAVLSKARRENNQG